jgi:hypothetical protein
MQSRSFSSGTVSRELFAIIWRVAVVVHLHKIMGLVT